MSVTFENRENATLQPNCKPDVTGYQQVSESQKYVSSQQSSGMPPHSHLPMKASNLIMTTQAVKNPEMLVQTLIST